MVRVPIDSLDTGNAAENEHTVEVLQPLAYPSVTIRALVKPSIPVPAGWNNPDDTLEVATDSTAAMQISLHGVTKTLEQVPVHLIYEPHGLRSTTTPSSRPLATSATRQGLELQRSGKRVRELSWTLITIRCNALALPRAAVPLETISPIPPCWTARPSKSGAPNTATTTSSPRVRSPWPVTSGW